jgi:RecA-family ATPase
VPFILPEGLTILGGKPKMGKSLLSLNLGLAIASGGKAFGNIDVEQGTVLYFSLEDSPRRLKDRILQMLPDGEKPPEKLILFTKLPKMNEKGLEYLKEELEKYKDVRLVIIDTFAKFRPPVSGNANLYNIDYDHVSQVKDLADEKKIAFLLVHHLRKSEASDIMDTFSGSLGLTAAADGLLLLEKKTGQSDAVLHVNGRDVEQEEFALIFQPDILTWENLGDPVELRTTEQQQQLLDAIKEAAEPLSPKDLSEITGLSVGYIKKTLPKFLDDGVIKKDSYGHYSYKSTPVPPGNSGDSGYSTQGTVPKVPTVPTPQGVKEGTLEECIDCKKNYEYTTCENGSKFF